MASAVIASYVQSEVEHKAALDSDSSTTAVSGIRVTPKSDISLQVVPGLRKGDPDSHPIVAVTANPDFDLVQQVFCSSH